MVNHKSGEKGILNLTGPEPSLDQKTILKWLREATKNIPDETQS